MDTDFKNAAYRHHDSAKLLYDNQYYGDSDHLYGLTAECGLKAIIVGLAGIKDEDLEFLGKKKQYFKHMDKLWDEYNSFLNGRTASNYSLPFQGNPFGDWDMDQRYASSKHFNQNCVERHRQATIAVLEKLEQWELTQ